MKKGFTLIELILVMGIAALLMALGSITFFSSYKTTNLAATEDILISDLRSQQARAMSGEGIAGNEVDSWGIKINSDNYVLFADNYVPGNPNNSVIDAPEGYTLSSTFPNSGEVRFARGSGEVIGFIDGQDTITMTSLGSSKVLELNNYGVIIGD